MIIFVSSVFLLLLLASIVYSFSRKFTLPYTIVLFVVGMGITPLRNIVWGQETMLTFSPDLLFYVFLPVLVFEAWYNIHYKNYAKNKIPIRWLAILGVILSVWCFAFWWYVLLDITGYHLPLIVLLLLWAIVSATDPVAVLSLFKKIRVPSRLRLLFEGESLLNDGTAVALFFILLEVIRHGAIFSFTTLWWSFVQFFVMIWGGVIVGSVFGVVFAKLVKYIKNNEAVEITITMILAHLTFLFCEYLSNHLIIGWFDIHISGVIATAFAAIIMGNYGRVKISPKIEQYVHKFWGFFSFVANSLIFLLMGLSVQYISIPLQELSPPLLILIGILLVSRAVWVYIPLNVYNLFCKRNLIPSRWQHLLVRWGLRGAVGLTMAFMVPEWLSLWEVWWGYALRDLILSFTIGIVIFSLLVEGLTIRPLIRKLRITTLQDIEQFQQLQAQILLYNSLYTKTLQKNNPDTNHVFDYKSLSALYLQRTQHTKQEMTVFLNTHKDAKHLIERSLWLRAIGIELYFLKKMYTYEEITEPVYIHLLDIFHRQQERLEKGEQQIQPGQHHTQWKYENFFLRFLHLHYHRITSDSNQYLINRAKFLITNQVIEIFTHIQKVWCGYPTKYLTHLIQTYKVFRQKAEQYLLANKNSFQDTTMQQKLLENALHAFQEDECKFFFDSQMITENVYQYFIQTMHKEDI